jgi:ATP-dependent DNA helicase RecG
MISQTSLNQWMSSASSPLVPTGKVVYRGSSGLQGGASDCRNRTLQRMFLMIGLGERAGSGMAKIQLGWAQTGGKLRLVDSFEPFDQTRLEMDFAGRKDLPDVSGKVSGEMSGELSGKMSRKMSGKVSEVVLELIKELPERSIPDLAIELGKSERTVERAIRELKSTGKLARVGPDKGGRWKVTEGD